MEQLKEMGFKQKIIKQLPKGVSIKDFWDCVKLYEKKHSDVNPTEKYKSHHLEELKNELYTDKMIAGTLKDLPELLKEIKIEYKGGV